MYGLKSGLSASTHVFSSPVNLTEDEYTHLAAEEVNVSWGIQLRTNSPVC